MRKFLFSCLLSIVGICFPASLHAQFQGFVGLQTVNATLANGLTCTGTAQNFITGTTAAFSNLGQTSHLATATSNATQFQMEIDGIDLLGNVFRLSDLQVGIPSSAKGGLVVTAAGYMPRIQVSVTCAAGATFSVSYSGNFSPQPPNIGGALLVATDKLPFQTAAANATASTTFQSPSGNSGGTLIFQYAATGPVGSSVAVTCLSNSGSTLQTFTFPLATANTPQLFSVTQASCPFVQLTYTSGGASATTYNLEYVFNQSGTLQTLSTSGSGPSATLPVQVVSDSLSQAFVAASSLNNPVSNELIISVDANNGARSIFLDKAYLSCSVACIFQFSVTSAQGVSCSAGGATNQKSGSTIASTAHTSTGPCTTNPTPINTILSFFVAANTSQIIDLRGFLAPAAGVTGLDIVNVSGFTGNSSATLSWYEK